MVRWHHRLKGHEFEQTIDSMDMSLRVKNGKPGMLQSMVSQRVGHDLATEE